MSYIIGFIIFICVLFIYMHIVHQLKRSEDLEIYEMDYNNNIQLQEICDVKQPVLFEFEPVLPELFQNSDPSTISSHYGEEIVLIKDTRDYSKVVLDSSPDKSVDSVPIKYGIGYKLFLNDTNSHYYTENNQLFLEETDLVKKIQTADEFLKPTFTAYSKYDFMSGSAKTCTPLRYHLDYRQYYIVTSGKINVKMTPWKSCKYLSPIKDYENYEFRSTFNPWITPSPEMEKVRFLEFTVEKGSVLYIPPYWWYSIQFTDKTAIYAITYNSAMNIVTYSPQWTLYFLQQQNIKQKVTKTIDISQTSIDNTVSSNQIQLESTSNEIVVEGSIRVTDSDVLYNNSSYQANPHSVVLSNTL